MLEDGKEVDSDMVPEIQIAIATGVEKVLCLIHPDWEEDDHLKETPCRVGRAAIELMGGYFESPEKIMKSFKSKITNDIVTVLNIEFYSLCAHHMVPFIGQAHVAYLPKDRVIGLSKIARIVDIFARRLQVQEAMTYQIANAIMDSSLDPKGVGVITEAKHLCMASRGVGKQRSFAKCTALRGVFLTDPDIKQEFIASISNKGNL